MKIKEALEDGTLSLEDNIDYADMTEEEYKQEIERLNNIIKEVRELRKKISNLYYEEGFELDIPMLLKYIDEILDKGEQK